MDHVLPSEIFFIIYITYLIGLSDFTHEAVIISLKIAHAGWRIDSKTDILGAYVGISASIRVLSWKFWVRIKNGTSFELCFFLF